jgi:hypothetical protein
MRRWFTERRFRCMETAKWKRMRPCKESKFPDGIERPDDSNKSSTAMEVELAHRVLAAWPVADLAEAGRGQLVMPAGNFATG